jgi:hypothetical protein
LINTDYKKNVVVIRKIIDEEEAKNIIDEKKTTPFRVLLKKPDKSEVTISSLALNYESILMVSGRYEADYYQKAVHPISVNYNVTEVVLGDGVFPIQPKSALKKAFSGKKGKNKVDLELEEHTFIDDDLVVYFDRHGVETELPFKMEAKNMENYPTKILQDEHHVVKKSTIGEKEAIERFCSKLNRPKASGVRDLNEKITINEITEIYIPIYEARLSGPKNKVEILRLDAARNKFL